MIIPSTLGNLLEVCQMNREEILEKSRQENDVSDERTKYISLKGANFSVGVLIFLWIALSRLVELDDTARSVMGLLVNTTCFSNFAYQFTHNRTKTVIFFTVVFGAAALFYLVVFLKLNLKLF